MTDWDNPFGAKKTNLIGIGSSHASVGLLSGSPPNFLEEQLRNWNRECSERKFYEKHLKVWQTEYEFVNELKANMAMKQCQVIAEGRHFFEGVLHSSSSNESFIDERKGLIKKIDFIFSSEPCANHNELFSRLEENALAATKIQLLNILHDEELIPRRDPIPLLDSITDNLPDVREFYHLEQMTTDAMATLSEQEKGKVLQIAKSLFTLDMRYVREFLRCIKSDINQTEHIIDKITIFAEEMVTVMGYFSSDAVLAYCKELAGRRLTREEVHTLVMVKSPIVEAQGLRKYFLSQFSTIDSGIIDLSGRSDLWYHTPNQSWEFSEVVSIETIERSFAPTFRQTIEYLLSDCLERRISIIDLGCGNGVKAGLFTKELEAMNPTLYLADANDEVILPARRNAKKFFSGIPRAISFDLSEPCDSPFSKIDGRRIFLFLGQTLGNFDDPRQIMQNISDGLKPGDYLVLEVDLEKDVSHYKRGESFLRGYMRLIGFSDNDLDYHVEDTSSGISMYFTTRALTEAKTSLYQKMIPEGTKIMVGSSAKFTSQTILKLIGETGLENKIAYQPEESARLVAVSQKH